MARIKVLSIVGPGRSGTTVLAGILGTVDGVVDVGELRWLWRRGLLERRTCGCGLPVDECPLWSAVVAEVMAGRTGTAAEVAAEVADAQGLLVSRRHRLRVIRRAATGADWPPLQPVTAVTAQLVQALAEVSGARVVVDSSKRAQDAAVLSGLPEVDHYVLHMVRDPRAVAFSWSRRDKTIRVAEGTRPMGSRGLLSSVSRWMENGLGAAALRPHLPADRWMFLRYEDFATQPRATISRILDFLGHDGASPFVDDDSVELDVNHTVAGNPNRFRVGRVTIRSDDEWRRRMPRHRQLLVQALTWPLRRRLPGPCTGGRADRLPPDGAQALARTRLTTRFTRRAPRASGSEVRTRR
jgi:hypothetical protein